MRGVMLLRHAPAVLLLAYSLAAPALSQTTLPSALPLAFEPYVGSAAQDTHYVARGPGYAMYLGAAHSVVSLPGAPPLRFTLLGADAQAEGRPLSPLKGVSHYLHGAEPQRWRTHVPQWAKLRFDAVYPGIDVTFYGNQGQLEYDFIVHAGADPGQIALSYEGTRGLALGPDGSLLLYTERGVLRQHPPYSYQLGPNGRETVPSRYLVEGQQVRIALGSYDPERTLIIDPVLTYSSYLGGAGEDVLTGVALDPAGNVYISGYTDAQLLPAPDGGPNQNGGGGHLDAFVTKLDPTATSVLYTTYFGGAGLDIAEGIAVDSSGNAYIAGFTESADFPGSNNTHSGVDDGFVVKLDATGTLSFTRLLGGSDSDRLRGIAVDDGGQVHVVGTTASSDIATVNPMQPALADTIERRYNDAGDLLVARLAADGTVRYATYLGGADFEEARAVAAAPDGSATYVVGRTFSLDFPVTANAAYATKNSAGCTESQGCSDIYLARLDYDGSVPTLGYGSYLGGGINDFAYAVAADADGNVYVGGATVASDFPTRNALDDSLDSFRDGALARFAADGSLTHATYLGGDDFDQVDALVVHNDDLYVGGSTGSSNGLPTLIPWQANHAGGGDAFVMKLTATGLTPTYASYLGGTGADDLEALVVDQAGALVVVGNTRSFDYPVREGALQASRPSTFTREGFITRIAELPADLEVVLSELEPAVAQQGNDYPYQARVTNLGPDIAVDVALSANLTGPAELIGVPSPCVLSGATINCALGAIQAGSSLTLDFTARGNASGTATLNASVSTATTPSEIELSNNSDRVDMRINAPPSAQDGSLTTDEDIAKNGVLSGNDAENNGLTFRLDSNGSKGTAVITDAASGAYTYTPASDVFGSDSFTYSVVDGDGAVSNIATVTVTIAPVNDAPEANDQLLFVLLNTPTSGILTASDIEGDTLTYEIVSNGSEGSAVISGDPTSGAYTYTPLNRPSLEDFNTIPDSFTFRTRDANNAVSNVATVTVNIHPPNEAPLAQNGQLAVTEDLAVNGTLTASDPDGHSLTFRLIQAPSNGTVAITDPVSGAYTYTPHPNANGNDSFSFAADDWLFSSNIATMSITIQAVNDAPRADADSLTLAENSSASVDVLGNDNDPDGDALTILSFTQPAHGSLSHDGVGRYTYRPEVNYSGSDTFSYTVRDPSGLTASAAVAITVTNVDNPPLLDRRGINGLILAAGMTDRLPLGVIDPDIDSDNDTHTYTVSATTLGSAHFEGSILSYTATTPGSEKVLLTVTDSSGLQDSYELPITVNPLLTPDIDGDGVSDDQARAVGLDPITAGGDTDRDGIPDRHEIGDPATSTDSDSDGVIDALEVGEAAHSPQRMRFVVPHPIAAKQRLDDLGGKTITITALTTGVRIDTQRRRDDNSLPLYVISELPAPEVSFSYPLGVLWFTVTNFSQGGAQIEIQLPEVDLPELSVIRAMGRNDRWLTIAEGTATLRRDTRTILLNIENDAIYDRTVGATIDLALGLGVEEEAPLRAATSARGSGGGALHGVVLLLLGGAWLARRARSRIPTC